MPEQILIRDRDGALAPAPNQTRDPAKRYRGLSNDKRTGDRRILEMDPAEQTAFEAREAARGLEAARASALMAVEAERDRRLRAGFLWPPAPPADPADQHPIQCDEDSFNRIMGVATGHNTLVRVLSQPFPPGGQVWRAGDNVDIVLADVDEVTAFGQRAGQFFELHMRRSHALKDAVRAAPDAATIRAIDITDGWPT